MEENVDVSVTLSDHKRGFLNIDVRDRTIAKAGVQHRRPGHFWQVLIVDAVIFLIIPLQTFLAWRILHPTTRLHVESFFSRFWKLQY